MPTSTCPWPASTDARLNPARMARYGVPRATVKKATTWVCGPKFTAIYQLEPRLRWAESRTLIENGYRESRFRRVSRTRRKGLAALGNHRFFPSPCALKRAVPTLHFLPLSSLFLRSSSLFISSTQRSRWICTMMLAPEAGLVLRNMPLMRGAIRSWTEP